MTDETWSELFEITRKSHINGCVGLSDEDLRTLSEARKQMQLHERMRLLGWSRIAAGTAWLDFGEISESIIEIDDRSSHERESRPFAYISHSSGYSRRVETIDIIESVRRNPISIGHPAIAFAIHRWQEVIQAERVIDRDDVDSQSEFGKELKRVFGGGKELDTSKRNLEALTKAFHEGIRAKRISKEVALTAQVKSMGLDNDNKDNLLYKAWERLASEHIDETDEADARREKIAAFLREAERSLSNSNVPIRKIMEFLGSDGARFVYDEHSSTSQRPAWKVFRNAFLAWNFLVKQPSIQEYLEKGSRQEIPTSFNPFVSILVLGPPISRDVGVLG